MSKKNFKNVALALVSISSVGLFNTTSVLAAENHGDTTITTKAKDLSELPDNQVVMSLPEGGFIANADGSSEFSQSQVEQNGGTLQTIAEVKEQQDKQATALVSGAELFSQRDSAFRNANPYTIWTRVLGDHQYYESLPFGGRGWQFSGLKFRPAPGTGSYLAWHVEGDSGRVGTFAQAEATYLGNTQGVPIYIGQRQYVDSAGQWLMFYTLNPAGDSKYIVENW